MGCILYYSMESKALWWGQTYRHRHIGTDKAAFRQVSDKFRPIRKADGDCRRHRKSQMSLFEIFMFELSLGQMISMGIALLISIYNVTPMHYQ